MASMAVAGWSVAVTASAQDLYPSPDRSTLAASSAEPAAATAWTVELLAPEPLKALLERYLDLTRLQRIAPKDVISADELQRLIDAVPRQVRELAETEGFFDAKVSVEKTLLTADRPTVALVIRVEPGPIARIKDVQMSFAGELQSSGDAANAEAGQLMAQVQKAWPMRSGTPFRNPLWVDAKSALLTQLRSAGFVAASFDDTRATIDPVNHTAQLTLRINSGPLFRSGTVEIEGLALHERSAVLNQARFGAGTPLTDALLLDFQERLLKSGLFEQVSVTFDTDAAQAAAATVKVRVKELAPHQLVTGVGYSSNVGPRVTAEYVGRRFLGWQATLRNKAEWSERRQALDGELSSHVRADYYRWFGGLTLERLLTNSDVVLAQRLRLGRALEFARIDRSQFLEWDRNTRRTDLARDVAEAVTLNQTWLWRDIDNPLLPTDGETLGMRLGVGQIGNSGSGNGPVALVWGRGTFYRPLGSGWFGQMRLEAGQVFAKTTAVVTDGLGFRAGGDNSIRGYAHRSIGPVRDGAVASGKAVATGSLELARPLSAALPSLWGAVFIDAGDAADSWRDLKPVTGTGVGLRWRSPVGPLQVDLAYGQATRRVRLHFSVGIAF
jgi:translocation and assembly module TamA